MINLRFAILGVALLLGACRTAAQKPDAPGDPAPSPEQETAQQQTGDARSPAAAASGLLFEVQPPEAEIIIDERSYGAAASLRRVPLPPGIYRVAVKAPGHTTWRAEVAVGEAMETLTVTLPRR